MRDPEVPDVHPEGNEWEGLTLIIGDELQKDLDRKLISPADVKEAIWLAETSGEAFYHDSDDRRLCSLVKPVITYWVEYREVGPRTYEVLSAYYHRMRLKQGE